VVLVGHSGGGTLLPVIADGLAKPVRGLIFVDSGIPESAGETAFMPPALLEEFGTLAVDGILPPWPSWFGEAAMREEVPDEPLRQTLVREMPNIPLSFLEQRVPSPPRMGARTLPVSAPLGGIHAIRSRGARARLANRVHRASKTPPYRRRS
jgi:pimeloyl-ACP methyl ester carboxylesterase